MGRSPRRPGHDASRRRGSGDELLEPGQEARERVGLGPREVLEQPGQTLAEESLGAAEAALAVRRQGDRLPAPVGFGAPPRHQPRVLQRRDELGDGRRRDPGPAGQVRADGLAVADRPQSQVLRRGEGRLVAGQEALDPAADQRGDAAEGLGGPQAALARRSGWRIQFSLLNY